MQNNYISQFWQGVVEDRFDPLKMRVRVRIIGIHPESKAAVPTEALPWAQISMPPTSMLSIMMPREGDFVHGYFLDNNAEHPVVMGVLSGIRLTEPNPQIGFNDPRTPAQKSAAPMCAKGVVYEQIGIPAKPYVGMQDLKLLQQTTVYKANQNLEHVCDIAQLMKRNAALARLKFSEIMSSIRDAIKTVLKSLGLLPSGEPPFWLTQAKKLARELKNIAKSISEIADLATVVVDFAKRVRAMIDYINGLPSKLYALLKQCLSDLVASLSAGFTELFSLSGKTDFTEAIAVFNDIKKSAGEVYTAGLKVVAAPVAVVQALTTPGSASDVATAGQTLNTYLSSLNPTSTTTDITKFTTN